MLVFTPCLVLLLLLLLLPSSLSARPNPKSPHPPTVESQTNALFAAIASNDVNGIHKALKGEVIAELDRQNEQRGLQTPLMFATLSGKVEAVIALLSYNPDVAVGEKEGYTPLHGAGFQGRAKIAKELIAHGLDPREKHADGYEPIFRACWGKEQRHTDTVRVFIEAGVPVDVRGPNGIGLKSAAKNNPNTVKMIIEYEEKKKAQTAEL